MSIDSGRLTKHKRKGDFPPISEQRQQLAGITKAVPRSAFRIVSRRRPSMSEAASLLARTLYVVKRYLQTVATRGDAAGGRAIPTSAHRRPPPWRHSKSPA